MKASVSIVIPSLNARTITLTLNSLTTQTARAAIAEILVVGLDAPGLVKPDGLVRFISTGRPVCAAAARNRGVAAAVGEYIAFIDADCVAAPTWLERLLARAQSGCDIVGGGVTFPEDNRWQLVSNLAAFHPYLASGKARPIDYLPTISMIFRREVYARIGGLDESLPKGEDIDWTRRAGQAGLRVFLETGAVVEHLPPRTTQARILQHAWQSGYWMCQVRLRHRRAYRRSALLLTANRLPWSIMPAALATTARMLLKRSTARYYRLFLPLMLTKIAWCLGALYWIRRMESGPPADLPTGRPRRPTGVLGETLSE